MNNIIIIGGGDFAKKVIRLIDRIGKYNVIGYTDTLDKGSLYSKKYLGTDSDLPILIEKFTNLKLVLGIGGNIGLLEKRNYLIKLIKYYKLQTPKIISPNAFIENDVEIEEGSIIFDNTFIDFGVQIGKFSIVNINATICHNTIISDNVSLAPNSVVLGGCTIGKDTFIGANTTINPYTKVGKNSIIGSGSVVVNDCIESGKYFGNPAKLIKKP